MGLLQRKAGHHCNLPKTGGFGQAIPIKRRNLLFVYGTLMQGERAHYLLAGAKYLGRAVTTPGFTLFDLGPYPAAVYQGRGRVHGELYAIPSRLLARLDRYEGCPEEYQRILISTQRGKAWIYIYPKPPRHARRRLCGRWRLG